MSRFCAIFLFAAAACGAPSAPPRATDPPALHALDRALPVQLVGEDFGRPEVAVVRVVSGRTACRSRTGSNPIIVPEGAPRVGAEWRCRFLTSYVGDREHERPPWDVWIVFSGRQARPIDFSAFGMPGCWLLVEPENIVAVPRTGIESPMLWRVPGTGETLLRWTPPAGSQGQVWRWQMIVAAPGETPSGFLASAAIEVVIGS